MIIAILIVAVIATIGAWLAIKPPVARVCCGTLALLAVLVVTVIMTLNFTNHLGMKQVTTTTTSHIYSAGPKQSPANMVMTKPLGTAKHTYVLVYRDKPDTKTTAHNIPDTKHVVNAAKTTATYRYTHAHTAKAVTTTTRWRWRSHTWRFWLDVGDQDGQLVKKHTTVNLPHDTWIALTPKQAKNIQAQQTHNTPAKQAVLHQQLATQTAAYQRTHPHATSQQIKAYTQHLLATITVASIRQVSQ